MLNLILAADPERYTALKALRAADQIAAANSRNPIGNRQIDGKRGRIAVLNLTGIISHHLDWLSEYLGGGTSTESFGRVFDSEVSDPTVTAIVLLIDSPGGTVAGVPELADQIFQSRGRKPIIAIANSLAASAAYWIASAADEFYVTPSGETGSIGVFAEHLDISKWLEAKGLKPTLIHAGEYKVEGNQYEPLSDEAVAEIQRSVNRYYRMFVNAVAKYRGTTDAMVRSDFAKGRVVGAQEAVARRMADGIAPAREVIDRLVSGKPSIRQIAGMKEIENVCREFGVKTPSERRAELEQLRREEGLL